MTESNRLFLAIEPDKANLDICGHFTAKNVDPLIKWIDRKNWHITTVFIGDFPSSLIKPLISFLNPVLSVRPVFNIEFDTFCLAPDKRNPRMIWAKYHLSEEYDALISAIFSGLKHFYTDNRLDFNLSLHRRNIPHITLSRLRNRIPEKFDNYSTHQSLEINHIILFESILKREGAQYLNCARFLFKKD